MTVKEAAQKWGLSEAYVRTLCKEKKIANAQKISGVWNIPDDAQLSFDKSNASPAKKEKSSEGNGMMFGLIALGIVLGFLGGGLLVNGHYFFGLLFLLIGCGALTIICSPFFPNIKDEVVFAGIAVIVVICSVFLFGADFGSRGSRWGDLSDVEKENAKWAHEAYESIHSK